MPTIVATFLWDAWTAEAVQIKGGVSKCDLGADLATGEPAFH